MCTIHTYSVFLAGHENITVTKEGIISVINIDRDEPELKDNIIKCSIVAYELQDISAKTPRRILFIIEDINDNIPKIKILQKEINITEYEFTTIQDVFLVTDIDQVSILIIYSYCCNLKYKFASYSKINRYPV